MVLASVASVFVHVAHEVRCPFGANLFLFMVRVDRRSERINFLYSVMGSLLPIVRPFTYAFEDCNRLRFFPPVRLTGRLVHRQDPLATIGERSTRPIGRRIRQGGRPFLFGRRANIATGQNVGRFSCSGVPVTNVQDRACRAFERVLRCQPGFPTNRTGGYLACDFLRSLLSVYSALQFRLLLRLFPFTNPPTVCGGVLSPISYFLFHPSN